ncbi:sigma-70 family RNA polymerase sigma factor [Paenarthrobacter sp. GOM3]|uniref:sigma-70 family RNA polymerase sigma factor n=1 Tax=Paenarthrobacter sp. GOM3 TaxID=2782567 RepID=UPI00201338A9|nr:sigma-70 family RNA polymerase sigma factor [Paenarthrobacter sp. GOM3]WOH19391.1 sigma-70 family RNA polymerase sigma factor [Paenarthrobacter sp. GOM3]
MGSISQDGIESDGHLIEAVRSGDMAAFNALYERHISIASTVAKRNVDNPSDAEDVVADAFQSVLQSLVAGKGPDTFFRAYLLSTVTRLSHQRNRKAGKVLPSGDDAVLDQTLGEADSAISAFESHTVSKAFRALPERWQAVLWYLDVERMKPAVVAPILGLSPNAVSALALRAREGLRRHYLQFHIAEQPDSRCAEYASKLGSYVRGGLSAAAERKVREHLRGCSKCTAALAELKDVQGSMRAVLLPLVTGIPLAMWAGKGTGLGVLGGVLPAKAALAVPALAQPAVMAVIAAAGVGLVLGAVGIVDLLTPDAYMEQRAVETTGRQPETEPPATTPAPSAPDSPAAAIPPSVVAPPPAPTPVAPEPAPSQEPTVPTVPVQPPVVTPAPSPSAVPSAAAPVQVTGSAERGKDRGSNGTALHIDFKASGSEPLAGGRAVFSVGPNAWIEAGTVRAPEGWTCTLESRSVVNCSTPTIRRGGLQFDVTAVSKRGREEKVLTYSLEGTGIAPNQFSYSY